MKRISELCYRVSTTILLLALRRVGVWFGKGTIYKVGSSGAAALFEGSWFSHNSKEFGCTGNVDWTGEAENETRHAMFERMIDGQVFYDIGAHGGVYTITASKRFTSLVAHSFEPQPEELLRNLSLNGLTKERVHTVALAQFTGVARMTTKQRSSNHISDQGELSVKMTTLDEYVRLNKLPDPDWLKIDIEGMELEALRGGEQTLGRALPIIICEINHISGRYGSTPADLFQFLAALGYSAFRLGPDGLTLIAEEPLPYSADWNYWFIPDSRRTLIHIS